MDMNDKKQQNNADSFFFEFPDEVKPGSADRKKKKSDSFQADFEFPEEIEDEGEGKKSAKDDFPETDDGRNKSAVWKDRDKTRSRRTRQELNPDRRTDREQKKREASEEKEYRKKHSFRRRHPVLFTLILLGILAIILTFLFSFQAREVKVTGDFYVSEETVEKTVFRSDMEKRLFFVLGKVIFGTHHEYFDSLKVRMTGLQSCEIEAAEKKGSMQIFFDSRYWVLNEEGVILGSSDERDESLILLSQLQAVDVTEFQKVIVENDKVLSDALRLYQKVSNTAIQASEFSFLSKRYSIRIGDVHVCIGSLSHIDEKLHVILEQQDHYKNLDGTLHMENYDGTDTNGFFFEVGS